MKKFCSFFAFIAVAVVMALGFTACGDDNNDDVEEPAPEVNYDVRYSVTLGEDLFKYFDFVLTYVDENGEEKTQVMTSREFNMSFKTSGKVTAKEFGFWIDSHAKNPLPEIDDAVKYKIERHGLTSVVGGDLNKSHGSDSSKSLRGEKFRDYVQKMDNKLFMSALVGLDGQTNGYDDDNLMHQVCHVDKPML